MNASLGARLAGWVAGALDVVAIATSALVTGLMLLLVAARYLLGLSIVGLHELILVFAVQLYMVGALIASRRRDHLTVELVAQSLRNPGAKALHGALVSLLTLIVCGFFVFWAYKMLAWGIQRPQVTPAYRIPLWIPQLAIMIAAVGCFAYTLRDLLGFLRKMRR